LTAGAGGAIVGRVGEIHSGLSLRTRLLLMWALSAALVVGGTTYVQRRIIVAAVEDEAVEAAGATALGVAAELTEREGLPSAADLDDLLADFQRMVPPVRGLTITRIEGDGGVTVATTTERQAPDGVEALSRQAIASRDRAVSDVLPGPSRLVAVPLERDHRPYGAVVVSISMEAVERVRDQVRTAALLFTPLAILEIGRASCRERV